MGDLLLDYARLLGFTSVASDLTGAVDFRDDAIGAKLGAKVGLEQLVTCDLALGIPHRHEGRTAGQTDFSRLLGFDTVDRALLER